MMNIRQIAKNKVVKNAGWIITGKVVQMLLSFFIGILTARYLGPGNYGLINYAAAYTSFFASFCTLGINSVIIKDFVDHPREEGQAIGSAIVMRFVSSLLSAGMIIGIVAIVDVRETLTIAVVSLSTISLLFQILDTFQYWFQAKLQSKYTAIATTIAYCIVSAYRILLLVQGKDVRWFAIANAVDYLAIAGILFVIYRKTSGPKLSFSLKKGKELLESSKSFILAGMMVSIYACTDRLMLKHMLDETQVGYYALAVSVSNMWVFVLTAIIDSMYPVIMKLFHEDKEAFLKRNKQLYAIVFYMALAASAAITIFSKLIISLLYGDAYLPAVGPLRIVVWYTAFSYLGVARNAWIVSEHMQKYLKYIYVGSACINVILNLFMIPVMGTCGAALASLITQISTVLILPYFIKDLRPNAKMMTEAILLRDVF